VGAPNALKILYMGWGRSILDEIWHTGSQGEILVGIERPNHGSKKSYAVFTTFAIAKGLCSAETGGRPCNVLEIDSYRREVTDDNTQVWTVLLFSSNTSGHYHRRAVLCSWSSPRLYSSQVVLSNTHP